MDRAVLGRNIYKARKDRKLTSERLSELCSINPSYLRAIEAGSKTPSLPLFVELCNKLKVSPSYLLCGVTDEYEMSGFDSLTELCRTATPSQLQLISAILDAAVNNKE